MPSIREAIQAQMTEKGIGSPYALAKLLKGRVSQATLYNYLSGGKELTTDKLEAVLDVLGITLAVVPKPIRIEGAGVNHYPMPHVGKAAYVAIEAEHWASRMEAVDVRAVRLVEALKRKATSKR